MNTAGNGKLAGPSPFQKCEMWVVLFFLFMIALGALHHFLTEAARVETRWAALNNVTEHKDWVSRKYMTAKIWVFIHDAKADWDGIIRKPSK
jgi:hypothetical protein